MRDDIQHRKENLLASLSPEERSKAEENAADWRKKIEKKSRFEGAKDSHPTSPPVSTNT
jgi:uncharacterized protein HemX